MKRRNEKATCETCPLYTGRDCLRYPEPIRKQDSDWCGEHPEIWAAGEWDGPMYRTAEGVVLARVYRTAYDEWAAKILQSENTSLFATKHAARTFVESVCG